MNNSVYNNIKFEFSKKIKMLMFGCGIFFFVMFLVFIISYGFEGEAWLLYGGLFWGCFMLLSFLCYFVLKKSITFKDNVFYVSNFGSKITKYNLDDVIGGKIKFNDGIILTTRDNEKFKIDMLMDNYELLLDILIEASVKVIDSNNNNVDLNDFRGK